MDTLTPLARQQPRVQTLPESYDPIRQKAEEFEAVFLNVMLASAFEGLGEDDEFSGQGADTWRSMQVEQFAKAISENGGIGIADQIYTELLQLQEQANQ
ncbi:MAG: rod-binding protein [Hyphomicrobiales bacterium]